MHYTLGENFLTIPLPDHPFDGGARKKSGVNVKAPVATGALAVRFARTVQSMDSPPEPLCC